MILTHPLTRGLTGPLVRSLVRAPEAVSVLDPASIANLASWHDFTNAATLFNANVGGSAAVADGQIGRAEDLSGNGKHIIQATAGARPLLRVGGINGFNCAEFDGTDDFMACSTFPDLASAGSFIAVFATTETGSRNYETVCGCGTGGATLAANLATYGYGLGKPGSYGPAALQTIPASTLVVLGVSWNGLATATYYNGTKVTANRGTAFNAGLTTLQVARHDNATFSFAKQKLCELTVYSRQLTDDEMADFIASRELKFGL